MNLVDKYLEEINAIKELIKPIVDEYYPSKANREVIFLYDLITCSHALQRDYKARLHPLHRRSPTFKIRYNKRGLTGMKSCCTGF